MHNLTKTIESLFLFGQKLERTASPHHRHVHHHSCAESHLTRHVTAKRGVGRCFSPVRSRSRRKRRHGRDGRDAPPIRTALGFLADQWAACWASLSPFFPTDGSFCTEERKVKKRKGSWRKLDNFLTRGDVLRLTLVRCQNEAIRHQG